MAMPIAHSLSNPLPWRLHHHHLLLPRLVPPSLHGTTTSSSASEATTLAQASSATSTESSAVRGVKIDSALERKIESSRIAIVVFSPKFADSTWCLWELTKILEMKHSRGQLVRPVFLGVEPSHVRKQTGVFAEIMTRHEKDFGDGSETVKKWRDALSEAANLSGWPLGNRSLSNFLS